MHDTIRTTRETLKHAAVGVRFIFISKDLFLRGWGYIAQEDSGVRILEEIESHLAFSGVLDSLVLNSLQSNPAIHVGSDASLPFAGKRSPRNKHLLSFRKNEVKHDGQRHHKDQNWEV
jgi:hypothetical protein